jgi:transposase
MNTSLIHTIPIHVGLDVHKRTISIAALQGTTVLLEKVIGTNDLATLRKVLKKLSTKAPLVVCYEAGGAGFALHRQVTDWGFTCQVIAPSLIPVRPGEKKKCDRLDAQRLAQYLASGLLTEVRVPTPEEEAARDLVRYRFTLKKDLQKARHRVVKFLRRKGFNYLDGENWTVGHRQWLTTIVLANVYDQECFEEKIFAVESLEQRVQKLERRIDEIAATEPYAESVQHLSCFRGISKLSAMVMVTELGDVTRFKDPRGLMAYLGLVPSVHVSGESKGGGGSITKAGNAFCRHVLVQAAWNYSRRPRIGVELKARQQNAPSWVVEHAWKAQQRLYKRFHHLADRRGRQIAVVAVARELGAFLTSVLLKPQAARKGFELQLDNRDPSTTKTAAFPRRPSVAAPPKDVKRRSALRS